MEIISFVSGAGIVAFAIWCLVHWLTPTPPAPDAVDELMARLRRAEEAVRTGQARVEQAAQVIRSAANTRSEAANQAVMANSLGTQLRLCTDKLKQAETYRQAAEEHYGLIVSQLIQIFAVCQQSFSDELTDEEWNKDDWDTIIMEPTYFRLDPDGTWAEIRKRRKRKERDSMWIYQAVRRNLLRISRAKGTLIARPVQRPRAYVPERTRTLL